MRPSSPTGIQEFVDMYMLDEMCLAQEPYDYLDKENGEYCLGYAGVLSGDDPDKYILINSLETRVFYQYSLEYVKLYLESCAGIPLSHIPHPVSVQIIQVVRNQGDNTYYAVNKTRWLVAFQRKVRQYYSRTAPHLAKLFVKRQQVQELV
jgi:hypothetical protein